MIEYKLTRRQIISMYEGNGPVHLTVLDGVLRYHHELDDQVMWEVEPTVEHEPTEANSPTA